MVSYSNPASKDWLKGLCTSAFLAFWNFPGRFILAPTIASPISPGCCMKTRVRKNTKQSKKPGWNQKSSMLHVKKNMLPDTRINASLIKFRADEAVHTCWHYFGLTLEIWVAKVLKKHWTVTAWKLLLCHSPIETGWLHSQFTAGRTHQDVNIVHLSQSNTVLLLL